MQASSPQSHAAVCEDVFHVMTNYLTEGMQNERSIARGTATDAIRLQLLRMISYPCYIINLANVSILSNFASESAVQWESHS
jgi:hypothetical protein